MHLTDTLLPAFLDMEASGFGRHSYPIEVGYVMPDGRTRCTLIRPAPHWVHWDPQAEQLHHIPREATVRHGRDVVEVARWLNDELQGMTVYTDGWANDFSWLCALFDAADCRPHFKLENMRSLLDDTEADHWHEMKQQVEQELKLERHRASTDARLLQSTFSRLRQATAAKPK
jgi:hypothetical protein